MNQVKISNVYLEFVFDWFYNTVIEACGDGAAVICCSNPEETSDRFIEWWEHKHGGFLILDIETFGSINFKESKKIFHPKHKYVVEGKTMINYHDSNENFMFCDKVIDLGHGDVSFIIEEDCKSFDGNFICKAIK